MSPFNRRNFLKTSGLGILPALVPFTSVLAKDSSKIPGPASPVIKLFGDGEMFETGEYIGELQKIHSISPIELDRYGMGGVIESLEKRFAEITGKGKAIFMPSGTLANQLAISVLSGDNSKVFVQDTSHVYRDEADAAQSVFQKRLMPLAKGETFFTAQELKDANESLAKEEAFSTGVGAVSIENPVRRTNGRMVPFEEIQKISAYCRSKNIKLHLDGARIYMASAWSGVSVQEYSSFFDTVYISLYKYLGASGGAILCGDKEVIDKMPHLIKVHGGTMFGNWTNAAMALHRLQGFETRLKEAVKRGTEIFTALNRLPGIKINTLPGGTNIYSMELSGQIDGKKFQESLDKRFNIRLRRPGEKNQAFLSVNETLLYQPADYIIDAFKKSI